MEAVLDKLFESTAKARLLKLFLMNPEREFIMPEIVKQTQLKKPAVQKELAKLMRLGLVRTRTVRENKRAQQTTKAAKVKKKITKNARAAKSIKVTKIAKVAKRIEKMKAKKKK